MQVMERIIVTLPELKIGDQLALSLLHQRAPDHALSHYRADKARPPYRFSKCRVRVSRSHRKLGCILDASNPLILDIYLL
jgi:hypothetical protein